MVFKAQAAGPAPRPQGPCTDHPRVSERKGTARGTQPTPLTVQTEKLRHQRFARAWAWTWVSRLLVEWLGDPQTPLAPPPGGRCHPRGPLGPQDKEEAPAVPLVASGLRELTARPDTPSLRH